MSYFTYIIFNNNERDLLDLNVLLQFCADPIRKSNNNVHTYVKYIGDMPDCVKNLTTKSVEYNSDQISNIFDKENWNNSIPF